MLPASAPTPLHKVRAVGTPLAAIRSIAAYLITLIYIAIAGPIGLVVAVVFRWKWGLYRLGHAGTWLALRAAGIRWRVTGLGQVPKQAVVFCSNHESNVDPPVLFKVLHPQLHVLYKAELHKFPIMGAVFDVGGFVPIDRGDRERSMASIARGAAALRSGLSFLIFPEGTRSRTGEMLPFKKGGFIMALQAQVPIVPVAVRGGRAAMRKGSAFVYPVTVDVRVGAPIPTEGLSISDKEVLIARVRAAIQALLDEGKQESTARS